MKQQLGDKLAATVRSAKQQAPTKPTTPPARVEQEPSVRRIPSRRVWPD